MDRMSGYRYLAGSNRALLITSFLWCILVPIGVAAQGPISGFLSPKGTLDVALSYGREHFDTYQGPEGPESTSLTTRSYQLYLEYALQESMSVVATLPWLSTDATNRGWQDLNLWIKYRNQRTEGERATSSFFTAVGIGFPVGNYPTGERNSLGRRATVFQGRLVWQLDHNSGWFLHAQSGIDFQIAPVATAVWPVVVRTGYGHAWFYVEAWLERVQSLSEALDNTLSAGAGSSWTRWGGTLYVPLRPWLGVHAGGAYVLNGQNIGLSRRWQTGIVVKLGR